MMMMERKPYRIAGAFDTETSNIIESSSKRAYPILYQLGLLDCEVQMVDNSNVESHMHISLYRHAVDLYAALDLMLQARRDYVPVIACHNLSFDMYALAPWLNSHDVRVLAKSRRKPITFTILDDAGKPALVIWDTLVFSQQPLSHMGRDCGYAKAVGNWDYSLVRTPETHLSDAEIDYASRDVYALIAWLAWWLRRNPDIEPDCLGLNVVTKTGVVRRRCKQRFDQLKGAGLKYNAGRFDHYLKDVQSPKSDDELFTMQACTRGGLTFCAIKFASVPFELDGTAYKIIGFDATSQHPAQMVSHRYPIDFHETSAKALENAFRVIASKTPDDVLQNYSRPFPIAVLACYEFDNVQPKPDTLFAEYGILPLASARFQRFDEELDENSEDAQEFRRMLSESDYRDSAIDPVFAFGKLISASKMRVWCTELALWEIAQAYSFDGFRAISGYITAKFVRPADYSTISVMQFYQAKNEYKQALHDYSQSGTIRNGEQLRKLNIPENMVSLMENGNATDLECQLQYLSLKADLNALFGINATNEYRRDTVLTSAGIEFSGSFGIENKPKNPKAWYQFGQRIVGWSRIAQILVMQLAYPYVDGIVNGDTDSVKFLVEESNVDSLQDALRRYSDAIDVAKHDNCSRVRKCYPDQFDALDRIGHYVLEFETDRFCSSWNKAYTIQEFDKRDNRMHFHFTLAGIPTKDYTDDAGVLHRRLNGEADRLYDSGWSFSQICDLMLGYNVTVSSTLTDLNARSFPEWGELYCGHVTDYRGKTSYVAEPAALALYPMGKIVNSTANADNRANLQHAYRNRESVNTSHKLLYIDASGRFRTDFEHD